MRAELVRATPERAATGRVRVDAAGRVTRAREGDRAQGTLPFFHWHTAVGSTERSSPWRSSELKESGRAPIMDISNGRSFWSSIASVTTVQSPSAMVVSCFTVQIAPEGAFNASLRDLRLTPHSLFLSRIW